jgi:hypothetical protein
MKKESIMNEKEINKIVERIKKEVYSNELGMFNDNAFETFSQYGDQFISLPTLNLSMKQIKSLMVILPITSSLTTSTRNRQELCIRL